VFESRVLMKVFGPKRDEVTGEWRKLHNEELSDLYSLPNIVRMVKSRRMRWAGHVVQYIYLTLFFSICPNQAVLYLYAINMTS
jgi:hypothetical protein